MEIPGTVSDFKTYIDSSSFLAEILISNNFIALKTPLKYAVFSQLKKTKIDVHNYPRVLLNLMIGLRDISHFYNLAIALGFIEGNPSSTHLHHALNSMYMSIHTKDISIEEPDLELFKERLKKAQYIFCIPKYVDGRDIKSFSSYYKVCKAIKFFGDTFDKELLARVELEIFEYILKVLNDTGGFPRPSQIRRDTSIDNSSLYEVFDRIYNKIVRGAIYIQGEQFNAVQVRPDNAHGRVLDLALNDREALFSLPLSPAERETLELVTTLKRDRVYPTYQDVADIRNIHISNIAQAIDSILSKYDRLVLRGEEVYFNSIGQEVPSDSPRVELLKLVESVEFMSMLDKSSRDLVWLVIQREGCMFTLNYEEISVILDPKIKKPDPRIITRKVYEIMEKYVRPEFVAFDTDGNNILASRRELIRLYKEGELNDSILKLSQSEIRYLKYLVTEKSPNVYYTFSQLAKKAGTTADTVRNMVTRVYNKFVKLGVIAKNNDSEIEA